MFQNFSYEISVIFAELRGASGAEITCLRRGLAIRWLVTSITGRELALGPLFVHCPISLVASAGIVSASTDLMYSKVQVSELMS